MIGDLLDVSQIHAGKLALNLRAVDLITIVKNTVHDQSFLSSVARIKFNEPDSSEAIVLADDNRLAQVIQNFLDNALAYTTNTIYPMSSARQYNSGGLQQEEYNDVQY